MGGVGMSAPAIVPVCENCKRAVHETHAVALLEGGSILSERRLCSACRCEVRAAFLLPASWLKP